MRPLQNKTEFFHKRARLVFKPFWIVQYDWEGDSFRQLLDGDTRIVAGNLILEKDLNISEYIKKDEPLYPEGDISLKIIPSECPICNHEQHYSPSECIHFCNNCYRALELSHGEIQDLTYYYVDDGMKVSNNEPINFIPFWAFELMITFNDSGETNTLSSYIKKITEDQGTTSQFKSRENMIFIPALKYYGGNRSDDLFCRLMHELTYSEKQIITDKLNVNIKANFVGATLTSDEAKRLIPFLLYALIDKPTSMRLDKLEVQKYFENVTIHIDTSFLILVPFSKKERNLFNPLLRSHIPETYINGTWMKEWIRTAYFKKRG